MSETILMIEDEAGLVLTVGDRLVADGYSFESCSDGLAGEQRIAHGKISLVILDISLPKKNGFMVCKSVRDAGITVPILMLTARSEVSDRVTGLRMGADDYLCKPFDMAELEARIVALLRRADASAHAIDTETNQKTDLVINLKRGFITFKNVDYPLSAQEIKLLDYFYRQPDTIISREELLNSVWGYEPDITTRTIDVHVARLRQKMGDIHDIPKYIHTVRGIGYKFTPPK